MLLWTMVALFASRAAFAATYPGDAVKAAYLHRFAAYVEWPAHTADEDVFTIGVFGSDAVVAQLQRLLPTLSIRGKQARVQAVARAVDVANIAILFVAAGQLARAQEVLRAVRDKPVLVVTDDPSGLLRGAAINFVEIDRHVRFEVSLPAAERSGLKVDAALLAVASRVEMK